MKSLAAIALFACSCESITYTAQSGERFHMMTLAGKSSTQSVELPGGFVVRGHRADNSQAVSETKSGILLGRGLNAAKGWIDQLLK